MNDWLCLVATEPVILVQAFPTLRVQDEVGQLVGLCVAFTRDTPEAHLNAKSIDFVAECIESFEEAFVFEVKATGVEVSILTPRSNPCSHSVDHVGRVAFDDDFVDASFMLEIAIGTEHVADLGQSVHGGVELGTLAGRTAIADEEGFVVDRVDVEEDSAGCSGVGVSVVTTRAVGGDNDGFAMSLATTAVQAPGTVLARDQSDFVVLPRASAHGAAIAASSHEVVSGHIAFVIAPVVGVTPSSVRNIATSDRVLHGRRRSGVSCWRW